MKGSNLKYFVLGVSIVAVGLWGLAVTIPNSFTAGDVVSASKLNDNFTAVKTAVDALEAPNSVTSAKIANGAVNATKISDEPGFNTISEQNGTQASVSTTVQSKASITLAAPADGFAVVTANFNWLVTQTNTQNLLDVSLSKTANVAGNSASGQRLSLAPGLPAGFYQQSVALSEVFTVTAGNNTFHLNASKGQVSTDQGLGQIKMTVIYLPTRYGTGATVN